MNSKSSSDVVKRKSPSSYIGVALTVPVSYAYKKQDDSHSAAWYIGGVLRELIKGAGIEKKDVDGFAISSFSLGVDSAISLTQHFDIAPRWIEQLPYGGCSGVIALRRAARAVQSGDANIVACIGGDAAGHRSFEVMTSQFSTFTQDASFPYGAGGPNAAFSLITQHYMDQFGATREDFGRIAVAQRYNSNHYLPALFGHKTLSMEQYINSRSVAGPLHLFDCVMPCAGGEGFFVMSIERAEQLGLPYCVIASAGELHNSHSQDDVQTRGGWTEFAPQMYCDAGLTPSDIDLVQTYDDYPVISMMQFEDLGFCEKGEGPGFVKTTDLRFDASGPEPRKLPHNTSGGQLSIGQAGAAAGYMGVVENIRQLTGQSEHNQVEGARYALASGYGMINYDRGLCSGAVIMAASDQNIHGLRGGKHNG
ncbi:MAG: acetyl-CoA acetyltransferase [Arenicella sp.]|jgi:acetyl-CoA acetyltransferase